MTRMKAALALAFVLAVGLGAMLAGQAVAVDGHNAITYRGGAQGRVIFDGRTHAATGLVCKDCHAALFDTRKRGLIAMADHGTDRTCFACHDGKQAFASCDGCHRKVPASQ